MILGLRVPDILRSIQAEESSVSTYQVGDLSEPVSNRLESKVHHSIAVAGLGSLFLFDVSAFRRVFGRGIESPSDLCRADPVPTQMR